MLIFMSSKHLTAVKMILNTTRRQRQLVGSGERNCAGNYNYIEIYIASGYCRMTNYELIH